MSDNNLSSHQANTSSLEIVALKKMETAQSIYEDWHKRYDVDKETTAPWHSLVKTNLNIDRDLTGKTVLEIGCGRGGFACWMASLPMRPSRLIAADFAHSAVDKGNAFAASQGLKGIEWEVADIQNIPHEAATFDTVVSCETIEHVPNPKRAIAEMARVLKPGGRLFVTTPNYLSTMGLYRCYMRVTGRRFTEEGQPINNFMLLPLTRLWVARSGLRVRVVDAIGHYLLLPKQSPRAISVLDQKRWLLRWFALHSLVVAEKR